MTNQFPVLIDTITLGLEVCGVRGQESGREQQTSMRRFVFERASLAKGSATVFRGRRSAAAKNDAGTSKTRNQNGKRAKANEFSR